jgi:hypothetical protein
MITKELLDKEYYYIRDLDKLTSPEYLQNIKYYDLEYFQRGYFYLYFSDKMNNLVLSWINDNLDPKGNTGHFLEVIATAFDAVGLPIGEYERVFTDSRAHDFFLDLFDFE